MELDHLPRYISKKAAIGLNVSIGPFSIVHDNVIIEDNTTIESHCVIGYSTEAAEGKKLIIGRGSHIRSYSTFYQGSEFGPNLVTGSYVFVRENIIAGCNLQVGSATELEGDMTIGDYVKMHSKVHLSKLSTIGDFVWLYPRVQTSTDPLPPSNIEEPISIGDMAVVGIGSIILPGVSIGRGAFVGAASVVREDVPELRFATGNPASVISRVDQIINFKYGISYPWPTHFRRGYPEEAFKKIDALVSEMGGDLELLKRKKGK